MDDLHISTSFDAAPIVDGLNKVAVSAKDMASGLTSSFDSITGKAAGVDAVFEGIASSVADVAAKIVPSIGAMDAAGSSVSRMLDQFMAGGEEVRLLGSKFEVVIPPTIAAAEAIANLGTGFQAAASKIDTLLGPLMGLGEIEDKAGAAAAQMGVGFAGGAEGGTKLLIALGATSDELAKVAGVVGETEEIIGGLGTTFGLSATQTTNLGNAVEGMLAKVGAAGGEINSVATQASLFSTKIDAANASSNQFDTAMSRLQAIVPETAATFERLMRSVTGIREAFLGSEEGIAALSAVIGTAVPTTNDLAAAHDLLRIASNNLNNTFESEVATLEETKAAMAAYDEANSNVVSTLAALNTASKSTIDSIEQTSAAAKLAGGSYQQLALDFESAGEAISVTATKLFSLSEIQDRIAAANKQLVISQEELNTALAESSAGAFITAYQEKIVATNELAQANSELQARIESLKISLANEQAIMADSGSAWSEFIAAEQEAVVITEELAAARKELAATVAPAVASTGAEEGVVVLTEAEEKLNVVSELTAATLAKVSTMLQAHGKVATGVAGAITYLGSSQAKAASDADVYSLATETVDKVLKKFNLQLVETAEGLDLIGIKSKRAAEGTRELGAAANEAAEGISRENAVVASSSARLGAATFGAGQFGYALAGLSRIFGPLNSLFVALFPLFIFSAAAEVVSSLYDKFANLQEKVLENKVAFDDLAASSIIATDQIQVQNLKLEDQIAKLEGRPANNLLQEGLFQAKEAADKLGKALEDADKQVIKLMKEGDPSAWTELLHKIDQVIRPGGLTAGAHIDISAGIKDQLTDLVTANEYAVSNKREATAELDSLGKDATDAEKAELQKRIANADVDIAKTNDAVIQKTKSIRQELVERQKAADAEHEIQVKRAADADAEMRKLYPKDTFQTTVVPPVTDYKSEISELNAILRERLEYNKQIKETASAQDLLKKAAEEAQVAENKGIAISQLDARLAGVKKAAEAEEATAKTTATHLFNIGQISEAEELSRIEAAEDKKTRVIIGAEQQKLSALRAAQAELESIAAKSSPTTPAADVGKYKDQILAAENDIAKQKSALHDKTISDSDKVQATEVKNLVASEKRKIDATENGTDARIAAIQAAEQKIADIYKLGEKPLEKAPPESPDSFGGPALAAYKAFEDEKIKAIRAANERRLAEAKKAAEQSATIEHEITRSIIDDAKNLASEQITAAKAVTEEELRLVSVKGDSGKEAADEKIAAYKKEQSVVDDALNTEKATLESQQAAIAGIISSTGVQGNALEKLSKIYQDLGEKIKGVVKEQSNFNTGSMKAQIDALTESWKEQEQAIKSFVDSSTSEINGFIVTILTTQAPFRSVGQFMLQEWGKTVFSMEKMFLSMILKMIEDSAKFKAVQGVLEGILSKVFGAIGLGPAKSAAELAAAKAVQTGTSIGGGNAEILGGAVGGGIGTPPLAAAGGITAAQTAAQQANVAALTAANNAILLFTTSLGKAIPTQAAEAASTLSSTAGGAPTAIPGVIGAITGEDKVAKQAAENAQLAVLYTQDTTTYAAQQAVKTTATTGATAAQTTVVTTGQATQAAATTASQTAQTTVTNTGILARIARTLFGVFFHHTAEAQKTAATTTSQGAQTLIVTGAQAKQTAAVVAAQGIQSGAVAGGEASRAASVAISGALIISREAGEAAAAAFASVIEALPFPANIAAAPGIAAGVLASVLGFGAAAEGGLIEGAGTGTSDSIPTRLSHGEFVVKASSVKQPGVLDILQNINRGTTEGVTKKLGYAEGGLVGTSSLMSSTNSETLSSNVRESMSSIVRETSSLQSSTASAGETLSTTAKNAFTSPVNQEGSSGIGPTTGDASNIVGKITSGDSRLSDTIRGQFGQLSDAISGSTSNSNLALGALRKSLGTMISSIPSQDRALPANIKNQFEQVSGALTSTASRGNVALSVLNKSLNSMIVNTGATDNRQLLSGINTRLSAATGIAPSRDLSSRLSAQPNIAGTSSVSNTNVSSPSSTVNLNYHAGDVHALDGKGVGDALDRNQGKVSELIQGAVRRGAIDPRSFFR